jgi:diaminopimelate epimerase
VNVEFVTPLGPGHLALRVHERGSGETRSCGTGVCAAVVAAVLSGRTSPGSCVVDVPGGRLEVSATGTGPVLLTGPAELVASGFCSLGNSSPADERTCDAGIAGRAD